MNEITITRPDDWHVHLRDGEALKTVVPHTAAEFARAIVMPNLKPPVVSTDDAMAYRMRILDALPAGSKFEPLMTLYFTDQTTPEEIARAKQSGIVHAVKYYPAGATTNSDSGVTRLSRVFPVLEAMQDYDLPLLIHGEVTDPSVDIFDREKVFIETVLAPQIVERFPDLRVVLEHITTRDAADYVAKAPAKVGATITAHHLLFDRNALFAGGIRPHYFCLPILKREEHRQALLKAATGGGAKFFLGTDSAPHSRGNKESTCGHAGCYTAHAAIELYAEAFDEVGMLHKLEAFASFNGPDFYRLPRNEGSITLKKDPWKVAATLPFGEEGELVPLRAGEPISWRLV